jgi:hypothetical protein
VLFSRLNERTTMHHISIAALALLAVTSASADVLSTSRATADSASISNASQGNGNAQSLTINNNGSDERESTSIRSVPTVYASSVGVTAPCIVGVTGGASALGWGVAFGSGVEDHGCTLRETSRILHAMGETAAAVAVMCNNPLAAAALGPVKCKGVQP